MRVPGEKPLGAEKRTNNKLNPHMTPGPGIEPGTHWWEASALTTAPSLLLNHFFTICLGLYVLVIHLLCRQMIHTTAELVLPYDINCLGTSLKKLGRGISWASCKLKH